MPKTEGTAEKEETKEKKQKKAGFLSDACDIIETVLIAGFVILIVFTYILRPVTIDGRSMNPTFSNGDKVFMTDLFYSKPKYGDVAIIDAKYAHVLNADGTVSEQPGLDRKIIKRIIATQGQTIDIDFSTGLVAVDGKALNENYIQGATVDDLGAFSYPLTVPKGYVFVMGDNRQHSTDSRSDLVGLIPEKCILGHVFFRYYPFNSIEFF